MRRWFLWVLMGGLLGLPVHASDFAFGADLSFLKQAEDHGTVFKGGTNALPGLQIFKNHGYNWIRLRIFVEPVSDNLPNSLAYSLALAQDAKKLRLQVPAGFALRQFLGRPRPPTHAGNVDQSSHRERVKQVFAYTRDTVAAFRDAGVMPDMVQVGNEVRHGMLWPEGKLPAIGIISPTICAPASRAWRRARHKSAAEDHDPH